MIPRRHERVHIYDIIMVIDHAFSCLSFMVNFSRGKRIEMASGPAALGRETKHNKASLSSSFPFFSLGFLFSKLSRSIMDFLLLLLLLSLFLFVRLLVLIA